MPANPTATLNLPTENFINESFAFSITFDNTSDTDTGFGPFFDFTIPVGLEFDPSGASYLGAPVNVELVATWNATSGQWEDGNGNAVTTHPFGVANLPPNGTQDGEEWYLAELPFGSFVPDQPPATIDFEGLLDPNAGAVVGTPLNINVQGGFRFGNDALDNPDTDAPLQQSPVITQTITPTVIELTKVLDAPEAETATGENFPYTYTVTVDIANGQTINALEIVDALPDSLAYIDGSITLTAGGVTTQLPTPGAAQNAPDNDFLIEYPSFTGGLGEDIVITYQVFVPEFDANGNAIINAVIDRTSGDDEIALNEAEVSGTYNGTIVEDGTLDNPNIDDANDDALINQRSIATQKSVAVVGGGEAVAGATLEYTIEFQISDYFDFESIIIDDNFTDGQRFDTNFDPTLTINGNGGNTTTGDFDTDNFTVNLNSDGAGPDEGDTDLQFRISDELIDRNVGTGGILVGNRATTPGTTGTIVFRTIIQEEFTDLHLLTDFTGDSSVDTGDILSNNVTISGEIVGGEFESDDSSASIAIANPEIEKTIYAINGDTNLPDNLNISPGETVTYRLRAELPAADTENFSITDYLPLPVFLAGTVINDGFGSATATPPAAGTAVFGPDHNLDDAITTPDTLVPDIDPDPDNNTVTFNFGGFDSDPTAGAVIDILFTVEATDEAFADGLFLTNQAEFAFGSTANQRVNASEIIQIELAQPDLKLTKGVVSTDGDDVDGIFTATFTRDIAPTGINFLEPNQAGNAFSGTITSSNLGLTSIDSDLTGVDAGDLVKFAVVIENTGGRDAFDVRLSDTLPNGFEIPPGGLGGNLQVTDGAGNAIAFTGSLTDFFDSNIGLQLTDGAGNEDGAINRGRDPDSSTPSITADGSNIIVITYDLQVVDSADVNSPLPGDTLVNTATIEDYSAFEGGNDYADGNTGDSDLTDTATVTVFPNPLISKTLSETNPNQPGQETSIIETNNTDLQAVIGELVYFRIEVTIPEGTIDGAGIFDRLDNGLALVSIDSITASSGIVSSNGAFSDVSNFFDPDNNVGSIVTNGRISTINFGTLTNSNSDNTAAETIVIEYTAVVTNINNNHGAPRNNQASFFWDNDPNNPDTSVSDQSLNITIVEPELEITKVANIANGDAGDPVEYTITITADPTRPAAYDSIISDAVPSEIINTAITNVTGTGSLAGLSAADFTIDGSNELSSNSELDILPGDTITIVINGELSTAVAPNQDIVNIADVTYTSFDGDPGDQSPFTTDDTERTSIDIDAATVTVNNVVPEKSIVATSETHTTGTDVAIGETVRYRLVTSLSEGTLNDVQIRDNLPTGMAFLNDGTARVALIDAGGNNLTAVDLPNAIVTGDDTFALDPLSANFNNADYQFTAGDITTAGNQVTFSLGNITNSGTNSGEEFVIIEFNAIVNNDINNDDGDLLNNTFDFIINGGVIATSTAATVEVVEPNVSIDTTITTTPTDAGDTVVYQITVTNDANAAQAFDLVLTDQLNTTLLDLTSVTQTGGLSTGVTNNSDLGTDLVDFEISSLLPGQTLTFEVTATLREAVEAGLDLTNTANVTYTSLPATGSGFSSTGSTTPGVSGANNGERDGSGGLINDYSDSDTATTTLETPTIEKAVFATSNTTTLGNNVAIGEVVTYRLTVTTPEGTLNGLEITDDIPAGMQLFGTPTLVLNGFVGTINNSGGGAIVNGDPVSITGGTGSGGDVSFNFGQIIATGTTGTADNEFIIEYQAVVLNEVGNVDTTTLTNSAEFNYTDPNNGNPTTDTPVTGTPTVTVIEPELVITKNIVETTGDAGDTITIQLTVENTGDAPAYDIQIQDFLNPAKYTNVQEVSTSNGYSFDFSTTNNTVTFNTTNSNDAVINAGDSINFTFTATLANGVVIGETLTNEAEITAGDTVSGNDPNQRDISGAMGSDGINIGGTPTIEKSIAANGTSLAQTSGNEVAIGEVITYQLLVTVPEGTTNNLQVTDSIPDGLEYVAGSATVITSVGTSNGVLAVDYDGTVGTLNETGGGSSGVDVQFAFASVVNNGDPEGDTTSNDTFIIQYQAVVVDTVSGDGIPGINVDGTTLTNEVELTYDDPSTTNDPVIEPTTPEPTVTVVTPDLTIVKNIVETNGEAGDTITIELTVTNNGSVPAFDLEITDVLNPTKYSNILEGTTPTGYNFDFSTTTSTVTYSTTNSNTALVAADGGSITFNFTAILADGVEPGETLLNTATITQADTIPGEDPNNGERDVSGATGNDTINIDGAATIAKAIFSTSNSNTSGDDVAIGEIITYQLTIDVPEGTLNGLEVTDLLPAGLEIVGDPVLLSAGFAGTINDGGGSVLADGATLSFTGGTNNNDPLQFDFSSIVANGDPTDSSNTNFIIEYQAIVVDTITGDGILGNNVDGTSLINAAQLTYSDPSNPGNNVPAIETLDDPEVTVVLPILNIEKEIVEPSADAGDTINITFTLSNTGNAPAYDVAIEDFLDPTRYGNITEVSTPAGFAFDFDALTNILTYSTTGTTAVLPSSDGSTDLTFTFTVELSDSVLPGEIITNTATITEGDTVPGEDPNNEERDVSGDTDDDSIGVGGIPELEKSLAGTSLDGTSNNDVAIGEVVTYQLLVTMPEGTINGFSIFDNIPDGLEYVAGSATVITTAAGSSALIEDYDGTVGTLSVTGGGSSGADVQFDFGAIVNTGDPGGNNDNNDSFVIEYQAVVLNEVGNTANLDNGNPPQILINDVEFTYTDPNTGTPVNPITLTPSAPPPEVTIVEPDLAINKEIDLETGNAGDTITITLTVSNTGTAPAYDVAIADILDSTKYSNITEATTPAGFTFNFDGGTSTLSYTATGNTSILPSNDGSTDLVFTFTAELIESVLPGETLTNIATITAGDTIPGDDPNERDVFGQNDNDTIDIVGTPTIIKNAATTSLTGTNGNSVAVGEVITYQLLVTVPEGTLNNLQISDNIPEGLEYVAGSANVITTAAANGALTQDYDGNLTTLNVTGGGSSGADVQFSIASVVNDGDSQGDTTSNDTFIIEYQAVVLNTVNGDGILGDNIDGTSLINDVELTYDDPTTGDPVDPINPSSPPPEVIVVEPTLAIAKDIDLDSGNAGDTITISLVVSNTGNASAYDLVISDFLDPTKYTNIQEVTTPTGFVFDFDGTANDTVTYSVDPTTPEAAATPGSDLVFTFTAELTQNVLTGEILTNTATIDAADTIPGDDPNDRDISVDPDDDTITIAGTPEVEKSVAGTSLAGTTNNSDVAIGEVITYQLLVTMPEGTVNGFSIADNIPDGLEYVAGSANVITTAVDSSALDQDYDGTVSTLNVTGGGGSGVDIQFDFSAIVNNGDPQGDTTGNDSFVIEYQAVVLNEAINTANLDNIDSPHVLINDIEFTYTDPTTGTQVTPIDTATPPPEVTVVEPDLAINKEIDLASGDAGDTITITLTLTNTGTAPAYDVALEDVLDPTKYTNITEAGTPFGFIFDFDGATNTLTYSVDPATPETAVTPGNDLIFTFTAILADSVEPGETLINTATITAGDTIPGDDPNDRDIFGQTDNDDILIAGEPTIAKDIVGTSLDETVPSEVNIGEVITYQVAITTPEGTLNNLEVTDTLPDGLRLVPGSVIVIDADFNGSVGTLTTSGGVNSGDDITFSIPSVVSVGDPQGNTDANDTFIIEYQAVVVDERSNVDTQTLTNGVQLVYNDPNTGVPVDPIIPTEEPPTVEIVEPILGIAKAMEFTAGGTVGDAGDEVTITLQVNNTGTGVAYDVAVEDVLDPTKFDLNSINFVSVGNFTTNIDPSGAITFSDGTLTAGNSFDLTFTVNLTDTVEASEIIDNIAAITAGDTVDGDDPNNEERDVVGDPNNPTDTIESNETSISLPGPTIAKSLIDTSEDSTSDPEVAIGEILLYRLAITVQEGITNGIQAIDTLPDGLRYVDGSATVVTTAAGFTGTVTTLNVTSSLGSGDDVQFDLSQVTTSGDNNDTNNTFFIEYEAIVVDQPSNSANFDNPDPAQTLINAVGMTFTDPNTGEQTTVPIVPTEPLPEVSIVEPLLRISKDIDVEEGGVGETVTITLVVGNDGTADAFDVIVSDFLDPNKYTNIQEVNTASGFEFEFSNNTVSYSATGETAVVHSLDNSTDLTFTFTAELAAGIVVGELLTNTAIITAADTIPGESEEDRDVSGAEDNDTFEIVSRNEPPETFDVIDTVNPGDIIDIIGMGGDDPGGSVAFYTILSLPLGDQGILYLGDPDLDGVPINIGDTLTPAEISQLFFEATDNFTGTTFTYAATDNLGEPDLTPATVTLTPNRPPETFDGSDTVIPGDTISLDVPPGDDPDGTVESYSINTLPAASDGILYLGNPTSGGTPVVAGQILTPAELNNLFFESTGDFDGTSFTYSAIDEEGLVDPTPATFTINTPPNTVDVVDEVNGGDTINLVGLDGSDPDGTVESYTINTLPPASDGILYLGDPANGGTPVVLEQVLTPAELNNLFFEADPSYTGTSFTYSATDNEGISDPTPATVILTPEGVNVPPETVDVIDIVNPGATINLTGLDGSDPDGNVDEYIIDTLPPASDGILYLGNPASGGTPVTPGQILTPTEITQLFFEAEPDFTGNTTFNYSAVDNEGTVDPTPATVTITTNQPPETVDGSEVVEAGETVNLTGLFGNDPDGNVDEYIINTLPPATEGILYLGDPANGGTPVSIGDILTPTEIEQLFFEATDDFSGTSFTYSAVDDDGVNDATPATYTLTTPPDTEDVIDIVNPGETINLAGLDGSDPDGSVVNYIIDNLPPAGEGILYLGDPENSGTPVVVGQILTPTELNQLFFEATPNFDGTQFNYSAVDNDGLVDETPGTVYLTPDGANVTPETVDVTDSVDPGSTINLEGLDGSDPDGTVESYTIETLPPTEQGILYLGDPENGGTPVTLGQELTPEELEDLFFEATDDFTGTTFTYSATDDDDATDTTPATVTLTPNQPPETFDGSQTAQPGETVDLPGLFGVDPDGSVESYTINTLPPANEGTLFLGNPAFGGTPVVAGQLLTPAELSNLFFEATDNFSGTSFTYSATDDDGSTDATPATYIINTPPDTLNVVDEVNGGNTINLTGLGGTDPDGTVVSYTIATLPPASDGTLYLGDPANGGTLVTVGQVLTPAELNDLFFEADSSYTGTSFTYFATDNDGLVDETPGTVFLTPEGVNIPPETFDITDTLTPGDTIPVTGMPGDDPDGTVESYIINTLPDPTQGILFIGNPENGGIPVTLGEQLTPGEINQLFFESTDDFTEATFTYSAVDDDNEADPTPATVTLAGNLPPNTFDGNDTALPEEVISLDIPAGSDSDGNVVSYTIATLPPASDGILYLGNPNTGGTPVVAGQVLTPTQLNELFFETSENFDGTSFTYFATDDDGSDDPTPATYIINTPPDTVDVVDEVDGGDIINLIGLDGSDVDGTVTSYIIETLPPTTDGVLYLGDPDNGGVPVNPGQVLTPAELNDLFFEADSSYTGTSFTYSAVDNDGLVDPTPATVTLTPEGVNLPPETEDSSEGILPGETVNIGGLGGEDPDGTVDSYTIDSLPDPTQGILYLGDPENGGTPAVVGQELAPEELEDLFFEATDDFTGDTFTYSATDNEGTDDPTPATVTLTPNLPPDTADGSDTAVPGETVNLGGLFGSDPDGNVQDYIINTLPPASEGILYLGDPENGGTLVSVGDVLTPGEITQLFFEATDEFSGTTFNYSAVDNDGLVDPTPAIFTINTPPDTVDVVDEINGGDTINLQGLDGFDPDGTVESYTIATLPPAVDGNLYLGDPVNGGTLVTPGQVLTPAELNDLFFEADPSYTGTSFNYFATDNDGLVDATPATVYLTPEGVNIPPETEDSSDSLTPGDTINLEGLAGDDPDGTVLFYTITSLPPADQGTLFLGNPDNGGTIVNISQPLTEEQLSQLFFDSTSDFTGTTFTYTATDNEFVEDPTPATVTLTPNLPPETFGGNETVVPGDTVFLNVPGGEDNDGSVTSYTINTLPNTQDGILFLGNPNTGGTPVVAGQVLTPMQLNQLFFEATDDFNGGQFTYSATDNQGISDPTPAQFTLNAPPNTSDAVDVVNPGETINIENLSGSDPDGTVTSYTIDTLPPTDQGILFLGDPASGGNPVVLGQELTPEELNNLFFEATSEFTGTSFEYFSTDEDGIADPTPGTVFLTASPGGANIAPNTVDSEGTVAPGGTVNLTGLDGSDPDGEVTGYIITTLPPIEDGILYLGDPADGGMTVVVGQELTPEELTQLFFQAEGDFTETRFTYAAVDEDGAVDPTPAVVNINAGEGGKPHSCCCCLPCNLNQPNDIFSLSGEAEEVLLKFTLTSSNADFVNEVGVFKVDDELGTINGIAPSDALYEAAALESGRALFSAVGTTTDLFGNNPMRILEGFAGGDQIGFYLIQDTTADEVISGNSDAEVFFVSNIANADNLDHIRVTDLGNGSFNIGWEDELGGGDDDFNDIALTVSITDELPPTGNRLQGTSQGELIDLTQLPQTQLVTANFRAQGDSNLNNRGGLYRLANAQGGVLDSNGNVINPGDAGYEAAALAASVVEFDENGIESIQLEGGFVYAPYILAEGNEPYFPFMAANSDGVDHLRLLGDNTFGFEDLPDGGDNSFDDFIFQVELPTTQELGIAPEINFDADVTLGEANNLGYGCGCGSFNQPNDIFSLSGEAEEVLLKFTLTSSNADFVNEVGVFKVDDELGTINGIAPSDALYEAAALESGRALFSAVGTTTDLFGNNPMRILEGFAGGDQIGFYLIQDTTADEVISGNSDAEVFFVSNIANADNLDHIRVTDLGNGSFNIGWEDELGGGDDDFNDIALTVSITDELPPTGNRLQGTSQGELIDLTQLPQTQLVTANFRAQGDSNLNNRGGLYRLANAQGGVLDSNGNVINPGDAGYEAAALAASVVEFDENGIESIQLEGGFVYAPYILAEGNEPYFPFMAANSDGVDHLRLLGDNTFGFEDLPDGGDNSFDDFIFQVELPTTQELGIAPEINFDADVTLGEANGGHGDCACECNNPINPANETINFNLGEEDIQLKFTLTQTVADFVNEVGVFRVTDEFGTVNGFAPSDAGYEQAALESGTVIFSALSQTPDLFGQDPMRIIEGFQGNDQLGFYLIQNSTADEVLSGNSNAEVFFVNNIANADDLDHVEVTDLGNNSFTIGWEDILGGGDGDFNDLAFTVSVTNELPPLGNALQGSQQEEVFDLRQLQGQQVLAEFMVQGDSNLENIAGLYPILDPNGTVIDPVTGNIITPGQTDYAEAAIAQSLENGVQFDENSTGTTATLNGGSIYAAYILADGQEAYFSFINANADGVDHVRLLGDNTLGFEDLPNGGDNSFDDFVFQVEFTAI